MSEETLRVILILCIAFVVQWVDRKRSKQKKATTATSPVSLKRPLVSRLYRHSLQIKQLRQTVRSTPPKPYQTKKIVTYKV
ncbi:hypothetical protein BWI93_12465 [Siphonobacter sp. BAB-5385]|nr:hypothetical protein BWI93_12465 [Siphonobacter sp. BAB-5385]